MKKLNDWKNQLPAIGLFLLPLVAVGCQEANSSDRRATNPSEARTVQIVPVEQRPIDRAVTVLGSFAAQKEAVLSTKVAGRVEMIPVDIGSPVEAGQVVARIEPRDYELQLAQAEAALAQARARLGLPPEGGEEEVDLTATSAVREAEARLAEAKANRDRVIRLSEQGIVSDSEFEATEVAFRVAETRYAVAIEEARQRKAMVAEREVEVAIARQKLTDTTMTAPFEGVIQFRHTHPGEYLSVGDSVLSLVAVDPLRLRLEVPERDAFEVRAGQAVKVRLTEAGPAFPALLNRVSPALNVRDRMLIVEADVANDGTLHPGSFARAEIVVEAGKPALVVPARALRVFAGLEKVFVYQDGQAVEREVTSGIRGDDWIQITAGLEGGEEVILDPGGLRNGDAVRIGPEQPPKEANER